MYRPEGIENLLKLISLENNLNKKISPSVEIDFEDDNYYLKEGNDGSGPTFEFYRNNILVIKFEKTIEVIKEYFILGIFDLIPDEVILILTEKQINFLTVKHEGIIEKKQNESSDRIHKISEQDTVHPRHVKNNLDNTSIHTVSYFDTKQLQTIERHFNTLKEADSYVASLGTVKLLKRTSPVDNSAVKKELALIDKKVTTQLAIIERCIHSIDVKDIMLCSKTINLARSMINSKRRPSTHVYKKYLELNLEYEKQSYFMAKGILKNELKSYKPLPANYSYLSNYTFVDFYQELEDRLDTIEAFFLGDHGYGYADEIEESREIINAIEIKDKINNKSKYSEIYLRFLKLNIQCKAEDFNIAQQEYDMTFNPQSFYDIASQEEINESNADELARESHMQEERNSW